MHIFYFLHPCLPQLRSVQSLSSVQLFVTSSTALCQASLSITNSQSVLTLMSIKLVIHSNHHILCIPLLHLPSIFPSITVFLMSQFFTSGSQNIRVSSFSISPSSEYSGLISFRMDWLDLLAVQGILKSFLQHTVQKHQFYTQAFFIIQLSHLHMTTGKPIVLSIWTFVSKVMSLLFNILSRFVIAFHPRSKCLLISWLQSPSAVMVQEHRKVFFHCFHCFPIYLP